jgi:hypothetical protein
MDGNKSNAIIDNLAKINSIIFHPVFIPVYGMIILFSAPTLLGYLPFTVKKLLLFILLINNVLLPLSLLLLFRYKNLISSLTINNRIERNIPLIISSLLYLLTSFIIFRLPIPVFLKSFIISVFILSVIITLINFYWKISLHSAGAGALISLVVILAFKMYAPLMWYIISVIIISGIVLSSRLKLNTHSPLQVWLGLLTGFLGLSLSMMVF